MSGQPGTCFGFAVDSPLPFRFLRPGTGSALEIVEGTEPEPDGPPIVEWKLCDVRPFNARLHQQGRRFRLWVDDTGWFSIDPARGRVTVPPGADCVRREERLWAIPALLCLAHRGDVGLHAAAVEIGGSAMLIAAPGRSGKTTLAGAFLQRGYRVLAEDIACVRPGDPPVLFPGPALLRVRRDSYERLGFHGVPVVADEPHRVHLAIADDERGDAEPVPIRSVVFLRQGAESCTLLPVPPERAVPDLMTLSFHLPTDEDRARAFAALVGLATSVPVFDLARPMVYERIDEVIDHLVDHGDSR